MGTDQGQAVGNGWKRGDSDRNSIDDRRKLRRYQCAATETGYHVDDDGSDSDSPHSKTWAAVGLPRQAEYLHSESLHGDHGRWVACRAKGVCGGGEASDEEETGHDS